jgi:hypothetical protein
MTQGLKQSTAYTFRMGPFLDSGDGNTEETGLTIADTDVFLSKAGGDMAAKNDTTDPAHDQNGFYTIVLNTTDTGTLGPLDIFCHPSGALYCEKHFMVVPAAVYDSLVAGSDTLPADVVQMGGHSMVGSGTQVADAFETMFNVASPVLTAASVNQTIDNPTAAAIGTDAASKVLVTPAQKLVTDASGHVTLANGAQGGAAAVLTLDSVVINNADGVGVSITGTTDGVLITGTNGDGLHATSSGGNGHGLNATGNGSGDGLTATGGATGHGIAGTGGASGGIGLVATGTSSNIGLYALGNGVAPGLQATGGTDGTGFVAAAGASGTSGFLASSASGNGITATGGTNGHGIAATGAGSGEGITATGGATGNGIQGKGGATSGAGIYASAQNNNDAGMQLVKHGTGKDLDADETDAILVDTAEIGTAGAGLTAIGDTRLANLDATVSSVHTDAGAAATDAAAVHSAIDTLITTVGAAGAGLTALGDARLANLDATVSSVHTDADAAHSAIDALVTTVGAAGAGLTALGDARLANLDTTVSSRTKPADTQAAVTTVGTVSNGVTVTANNDKTGYALSSAGVTAIRTELEANGTKLDHLWEMTEDDEGVRRLTSNALEQAPAGGGSGDATAANQALILDDLVDIKGTAFVKDTHSLVNLTGGAVVNVTIEPQVEQ